MAKAANITGQRFGMLTVKRITENKNKDGKYLWHCICDCGNDKLVIAASLINGSTKSCGCLKYRSKVKIGSQYGKLEVLQRVENKNGKVMFLCLCDCGKEKEYPSIWLLQGRVTSCGCSQGVTPINLTNKRFGHVVAIKPTGLRDSNSIVWECRCDCGNTAYRSHGSLKKSGENTNCGCRKTEISRESMKKAHKTMGVFENTSIAKLQANKLSANNKSGIRGVFFNMREQKWRATIGFQKKQIYLGQYDTIEEAAKARKRAEEEIHKPFIEKYYKSLNHDTKSFPNNVVSLNEYKERHAPNKCEVQKNRANTQKRKVCTYG